MQRIRVTEECPKKLHDAHRKIKDKYPNHYVLLKEKEEYVCFDDDAKDLYIVLGLPMLVKEDENRCIVYKSSIEILALPKKIERMLYHKYKIIVGIYINNDWELKKYP